MGTPATPPASAPSPPSPPSPREYGLVLVVAAVLGLPAGIAAAGLMWAISGITDVVWTDIPDALGWSSPAAWYVVLVPGVAGLLVALAFKLPGHGGHPATGDLGLDALGPIQVMSALAASLITLGLGLVLGPEAPLLALGLTAGLVASRALRSDTSPRQLIVLAGAFATISTVFGGPLPSALLLFEMAARKGIVPAKSLGAALVPGFLASGTAALAFTGVDHWPGVKETVLALPSLPNYPSVRLADIAWGVVLALAVGLLVAAARRSAREAAARWKRPAMLILVAGGLAVGALAVVFRAIADEPVDLVLFSGAEALGSYVAETSAGVLALLVIVKGAAYAISLAAGFRGGPTFPAVALGVALGTLGSVVLPGFDLTPAVIAGVAAGAAAALRLPIFGALLAFVMAGAVSHETIPLAVIASVIGWLAAEAVNRERGSQGEAGDAATAPAGRAAHV